MNIRMHSEEVNCVILMLSGDDLSIARSMGESISLRARHLLILFPPQTAVKSNVSLLIEEMWRQYEVVDVFITVEYCITLPTGFTRKYRQSICSVARAGTHDNH